MIVRSPIRHALPMSLILLLTLAVCLQVGAQNIPAPTADMLPTPEEIKNAPCFPFTDGTHPNAHQYRLPPELTVKDVSPYGDRVTDIVDGRPVQPGGSNTIPPASCRERKIQFIEYALIGPRFDRKEPVFHRVLEIRLSRYSDPAHVAKRFEMMRREDQNKGQLGSTLSIGDDAYLGKWNSTGSGYVYLHVQQGTFYIWIRSSGVASLWQEKLKVLLTYTAQLIVAKVAPISGGVPPPTPPPVVVQPPVVVPPKLEITAGPEGNPNPVAPVGTVQCSVQARHGQGAALSYRWTATGGSFNNPGIQTPIWTAPAAGGATQYGITVNITAADGAQIGASYLQLIGAAPDLHIEPGWIVLSYAHNNTFMQIEPTADQQCVAVQVKNEHPTADATNVFIQLSAGPKLGDGTHIGNPIPVGDLPAGQRKTVGTIWDLQGQNIENQRLYAHAYCQNMGDTNPDNDFASIDIEGIYYAHNGTRAFSFANDTFSFKNYGLEDRGIAGLVNQQAALLAGCLDRKQPKAPLVSDPFYMLSYMRYQKYMKSFNSLHIGGLCHGFVHAVKDHFENPSTRPVAKAVSAMTKQEADSTISIYHTTQMLRMGPALLTNTRYYGSHYGVDRCLATAESSLRGKRECIYIALAGYEQKTDGTKVGRWGHATLGFKLIKVAGRDAVLYVYDPNRPASSSYVQKQNCMTQIVFSPGAFNMPDNMNMIYHQTSYGSGGTRSRMYSDGIAAMPWLRDLSQQEVKATATAANTTVYAMSSWMRSNGLSGHVLRCPADAHFVDAQGRRTGVVGGQEVNEIPGAEVRTANEIEICFLPTSQQYQVVIEGVGHGQARFASIRGESDTRIGVTTFNNIPLRPGNRTVATLLPGGRIASLMSGGTALPPQLEGFLDQDDPAWGLSGAATPPQGTKLTVTSPTDGATVPEQFTISGTSVPGRSVHITAIAEATLKATGQNATSPLLESAEAKVGNDGKWSIEVNARAVYRDQRVELKQIKITVEVRANGTVAEQADLIVRP